MNNLEDTCVMIQRDAWAKQIEEARLAQVGEMETTVWTDPTMKTTSYIEEQGADITVGHCKSR